MFIYIHVCQASNFSPKMGGCVDVFQVILFANRKKRWCFKGYFLQLYHVNLVFQEQREWGTGPGSWTSLTFLPFSRSSRNIHVPNFVSLDKNFQKMLQLYDNVVKNAQLMANN